MHPPVAMRHREGSHRPVAVRAERSLVGRLSEICWDGFIIGITRTDIPRAHPEGGVPVNELGDRPAARPGDGRAHQEVGPHPTDPVADRPEVLSPRVSRTRMLLPIRLCPVMRWRPATRWEITDSSLESQSIATPVLQLPALTLASHPFRTVGRSTRC